jgi:hypothetical protein
VALKVVLKVVKDGLVEPVESHASGAGRVFCRGLRAIHARFLRRTGISLTFRSHEALLSARLQTLEAACAVGFFSDGLPALEQPSPMTT